MKAKTLSMTILLILMITIGWTQPNSYNSSALKLIPETSFLPNADWKTLFYDETQASQAEKTGLMKQVIVGPDEQVFISDRENFTITILDKTGRVVKTFGKKGGNPGEFINNQNMEGILNDKLLVVSDNQGRINFFDLQGNFVNMITIDFMPLGVYPLKSGNLIVWGHVPVAGGQSKNVLAEVDYSTGKYNVFYENIKSFDQPSIIKIPKGESLISFGAPYSAGKEMIRVTSDDRIILADNTSNIITIFSLANGKYQKSEFKINTESIKIGEQEKEEYYQKLKERLQKNGIDVSYAEKVKAEGFFPEHLPYFYNIILDDKNNSLFFIYTNNENEDYAFQAYSIDGKFLGKSEFKIEGYDLLSNMKSFIFSDGFVYTPALKKGEDSPLRILKCKIVNAN
jgi:hypothetical protein